MIAHRVKRVAALLGVSVSLVRREIRAGTLPCHRIGRVVLIRDEDLRAWIERDGKLGGGHGGPAPQDRSEVPGAAPVLR